MPRHRFIRCLPAAHPISPTHESIRARHIQYIELLEILEPPPVQRLTHRRTLDLEKAHYIAELEPPVIVRFRIVVYGSIYQLRNMDSEVGRLGGIGKGSHCEKIVAFPDFSSISPNCVEQ